ncbi:MAG TPA: hypothetical protein VKA09_06280 [Nitrososphaeraceae archaeon]|nr:hypothetical protein [Nitrososphaeraceae archaeon]
MKIKSYKLPVAIALLGLVMIIFVSLVSYYVATVSASDGGLKVWARNATVDNQTLDDHSINWWRILLETPLPSNPANDPDGRYCQTGVIGTTFYPYGNFGGEGQIRHCTIPAGMTIFGAALAFECSFDEYPQLKTLDELRSCTKQGADAISSYSVEIDGKPLNPSGIYRIMSVPFEFTWGSPNIYGLNLPAGKVGTSIQDGYFFAIQLLSPGEHRIRITGSVLADPASGNPGFALDQTYVLTIENPSNMVSGAQNTSKPFFNSSSPS